MGSGISCTLPDSGRSIIISVIFLHSNLRRSDIFFPLDSDIVGGYEPEALAWANHAEVLFEFWLQQHSALKDVRINVVDLIFATLLARDSTTIRCHIVPPDGSDPVQTTFTLRSLRINVFLIVSHVLEASL
jgi:hypothetical protein